MPRGRGLSRMERSDDQNDTEEGEGMDDDTVAEISCSSKMGSPNPDFTIGSKRESSARGGTVAGKMKKLGKEAERPRMVAHAVRDDLLGAINHFVSQGCMRFSNFRKIWTNRRLSCLHYTCPKRCEPTWFIQYLLSTALDLIILKDEVRQSGKNADEGSEGPGLQTMSSACPRTNGASRGFRRKSSCGNEPAGPTLAEHESGPGSLPFQIGSLYALYALHGTQPGRNRQPIRVHTQGLLSLVLLRKRLKAAGQLGADALAVLTSLSRGNGKAFLPAAYSGPGTLAYVDSLVPATKRPGSLKNAREDLKRKYEVAAAQVAAAKAAAVGRELAAEGIANSAGVERSQAAADSATGQLAVAGDEAASLPGCSRKRRMPVPTPVAGVATTAAARWGPQDRVKAAIKKASARVKELSSLYEQYSASLGLARASTYAANGGGSSEAVGGAGGDRGGSSTGTSRQRAAAETDGTAVANRNERFQQDLAAMLESSRIQDSAHIVSSDAYGLEHLARSPLIASPPSPPRRPPMAMPLPPLPPVSSRLSTRERSSRKQTKAFMAAPQRAKSVELSGKSKARPMRDVRDHIAVARAAVEEQDESDEEAARAPEMRQELAGGNGENTEAAVEDGMVSRRQTTDGNSVMVRLPGGLGMVSSGQGTQQNLSNLSVDGTARTEGTANSAAECDGARSARSRSVSRADRSTPARGEIGGSSRGRMRSGRAASTNARSTAARQAKFTEQVGDEEGEEDCSEADEIDDFERLLGSAGDLVATINGQRAASDMDTRRADSGEAYRSDVDASLSPPIATAPRKHGRPKKQPTTTVVAQGAKEANVPATKRPRGRPRKSALETSSPNAQSSRGRTARGRGGRGGRAAASGRGKRQGDAGVGGGRMTSIAAVEAAANARKREADEAKAEKAAMRENLEKGRSEAKHEEGEEDGSEDEDSELAFFERDVSHLSAIANSHRADPGDRSATTVAAATSPASERTPASTSKHAGKQVIARDGRTAGKSKRIGGTQHESTAKINKQGSFFVSRGKKSLPASRRQVIGGPARGSRREANAVKNDRDGASVSGGWEGNGEGQQLVKPHGIGGSIRESDSAKAAPQESTAGRDSSGTFLGAGDAGNVDGAQQAMMGGETSSDSEDEGEE